ncbi:hypothetical protein NG782_09370 [Aliarcobacter cryaerophilus]|uniref:hypothetical protein n=1 Tax=Aliarcobacter cryaerophilus TaxID=28198 RepID=UPI003DA2753D
MKIQFSKVTNTEGLLNKTFSIDLNGQVKKESNAFFSMGRAEVVEVNNLSEFYIQLENLQPNQAIISGITDEIVKLLIQIFMHFVKEDLKVVAVKIVQV